MTCAFYVPCKLPAVARCDSTRCFCSSPPVRRIPSPGYVYREAA